MTMPSSAASHASTSSGELAHTQAAGASPTATRQTQASAQPGQTKKVGLIGLVGIVISAMVGGGIFNLPQNMSADASAGGQIIAWVITGIGMWFIANTFRILSAARPDMKDGLYAYAYHGFGKYVGFLISYGYWLCNCFSLVAYGVLIMSTLDLFFPGKFTGGNNLASIIGGSLILWIMVLLALRGAKSGAFLNLIGTVCKIAPVLVFIVAMMTVFKFSQFVIGFWGVSQSGVPLHFEFGNVMKQVSSTMLVTLWLFLGIEGAVVISGEARSQKDVSKATTIGYLTVLIVYVLVSLLPLGVDGYRDIGAMQNPSMAVLMAQKVGQWGSDLVNVGIIISVLSAWLVWMIMLGQMPMYAARDGIFPESFAKQNKHGAPSTALIWTAIITQVIFVICLFVKGSAWNTLISITSVMAMPCYLLCCVFLWKIALKEPWPTTIRFSKRNGLITGVLGTVFALYLVYSAGLHYLMIACILYAIGLPLFIVSRREHAKGTKLLDLFTKWEKILVVIVLVAAVAGIVVTILYFVH
ncbi:basic amino acid/polyamine antiporter [Bifidobacterium gallicum]|nr:basic amino acid/polyamine antiporter [Bifidobacterium gallicum]